MEYEELLQGRVVREALTEMAFKQRPESSEWMSHKACKAKSNGRICYVLGTARQPADLELSKQAEEEELMVGKSGVWVAGQIVQVLIVKWENHWKVLEGYSECSIENRRAREGKNGRRENHLGDFL